MKIVFNTSPLIFLTRLNLLEKFLTHSREYYAPQAVFHEILAKEDDATLSLRAFFTQETIQLQAVHTIALIRSLSQQMGQGESEAITLALELNADYVILDDFVARREATRLGLRVKGTLAIIKKLQQEGQTSFENLNQLYESLTAIKFRIKRSIFDQIFKA